MQTESLNIIIASISATATVGAAVIYYWTLSELKRQRQNTYRPQLIIDSISFHVIGVQRDEITMPLHWTTNQSEYDSIKSFGNEVNTHHFNLHCYNIGFGTAKKVSVKFLIDIEPFINRILKLGEQIDPEMRLEIKNAPGMVSFNSKGNKLPYLACGISKRNSLESYLSFVLPVSVTNNFVPLPMPIILLEALNIFFFYMSLLPDKSKYLQDESWDSIIPKVQAKIVYEDIYDEFHEKVLTITTQVFGFGVAGYMGRFVVNAINGR